MQPLEAMTFLIKNADIQVRSWEVEADEGTELTPAQRENLDQLRLASSVATAMLNTALPIARFRCFVQADIPGQERRFEFTICGVTLTDIRVAMRVLTIARWEVYVTLWEQRSQSAEMICGYQGPSKIPRFRAWLQTLEQYVGEENVDPGK